MPPPAPSLLSRPRPATTAPAPPVRRAGTPGPAAGMQHTVGNAATASLATTSGPGPGAQNTLGNAATAAALSGAGAAAAGDQNAVGNAAVAASPAPPSRASGPMGWVLNFVRDHARSLPGYDLLGVILGRDPVTQQPIERSAVNLVSAVLALVPGGGQLFQNLLQAQVIQRATAWFANEIAALGFTWDYVRGLFGRAWDALSVWDLASPGRAWEKLKAVFGPPLARLGSFVVRAGRKVLEFVFEGALALAGAGAARVLGVFRQIGAVFGLIIADPVAFLGNLIRGVRGGITQFAGNIVEHLKAGLRAWLLGNLGGAGVEIPDKFDARGVLRLVLSVLGLTWRAVRLRITRVIPEPVVRRLESSLALVRTLATEGLPGLWRLVVQRAGDIVALVVDQIRGFVVEKIVKAGIVWLAALFNPAAAVIRAVKSIYDITMFVIERAQQITEFVTAVLASISAIAQGATRAAADLVERSLARALPVVLGLLANLVGLTGISKRVQSVIRTVQAPVTRAVDYVVGVIVTAGRKLWDKLRGRDDSKPAERGAGGTDQDKLDAAALAAQRVLARYAGRPVGVDEVAPQLATIRGQYGLRRLTLVENGPVWAIEAEINPKKTVSTDATVSGPKRGDHVFALGLGKTLQDMHAQALTTLGGVDLARSPAARVLVENLASATARAGAIPELVVRKTSGHASGGDAHSRLYGDASRNALLAVHTVAVTLARYYHDPTQRLPVDLLARHLAASAAQAGLAVNRWLDTAVDRESVPLVPADKAGEFQRGQQLLSAIRGQLLGTLTRLSGR
ncbi:phage tail protein [Goodfellowiella coeruleoviolacea]|uniref:Uncharacterized protein n=1 Tax=Goodfellowiella coeruleoviolacea TaxID=334858 RepID=A0AAE3G9I2_9PSEU|nr:hypothetical protein [Goodfellowiella coeruleoviolacea]MCP2163212.1 hypothetical protein [Goodfellowiella coeruleoviolacea]